MAPFRGNRSTRSGRPGIQADVDFIDGLPIRQWRVSESLIGSSQLLDGTAIPDPNVEQQQQATPDKRGWMEPRLKMPKGSELYPPHSQQLLRAARAGHTRWVKFKDGIMVPVDTASEAPKTSKNDEEEKENDDDGGANKERQKGFLAKRWAPLSRAAEEPDREYLAKRRKGLPPIQAVAIAVGALAPSAVDNYGDGFGTPEVTEVRRRAPPPRRKPKRGPGRGRKKLADTEGQGVSASAEHMPGVLTNGSATPMEGATTSATEGEQRDTPMKDGEEDGEDEDGDEDGDDDREDGELSPSPDSAEKKDAPTAAEKQDEVMAESSAAPVDSVPPTEVQPASEEPSLATAAPVEAPAEPAMDAAPAEPPAETLPPPEQPLAVDTDVQMQDQQALVDAPADGSLEPILRPRAPIMTEPMETLEIPAPPIEPSAPEQPTLPPVATPPAEPTEPAPVQPETEASAADEAAAESLEAINDAPETPLPPVSAPPAPEEASEPLRPPPPQQEEDAAQPEPSRPAEEALTPPAPPAAPLEAVLAPPSPPEPAPAELPPAAPLEALLEPAPPSASEPVHVSEPAPVVEDVAPPEPAQESEPVPEPVAEAPVEEPVEEHAAPLEQILAGPPPNASPSREGEAGDEAKS